MDIVNGTKVLAIYQPIQIGNRWWGVILIEPTQRSSLVNTVTAQLVGSAKFIFSLPPDETAKPQVCPPFHIYFHFLK